MTGVEHQGADANAQNQGTCPESKVVIDQRMGYDQSHLQANGHKAQSNGDHSTDDQEEPKLFRQSILRVSLLLGGRLRTGDDLNRPVS